MVAKKLETRTYLLELMDGGRRKLTIPAAWKITFGNVLPYNKTSNVGGPYEPPHGWQSRIVLRVYERSKDNLRAVMHDVLSFREESVGVMEGRPTKVTTAKIKLVDGRQDVVMRHVEVGEWFNPDVEFVQKQESEKQDAKRSDKRTGAIAL